MMEGQNTGLLECSGMGSFYSITCPRIGPVRLVIRQANSGPTSAECQIKIRIGPDAIGPTNSSYALHKIAMPWCYKQLPMPGKFQCCGCCL